MALFHHIIRPTPTTLAMVEVDLDRTDEDYQGEVITWAIPDTAFWAWLDHHPEARPYLESMQKDNPDRLKRARVFVGVLRQEKACIAARGLTRARLASERPSDTGAGRPVLIAARSATPR